MTLQECSYRQANLTNNELTFQLHQHYNHQKWSSTNWEVGSHTWFIIIGLWHDDKLYWSARWPPSWCNQFSVMGGIWVILHWPGIWFATAALQRHLFLVSFKKISILVGWFLGIVSMTTMLPSPFCHGNYVDDCVSRVSLLSGVHTHSTDEGNVSRTLQALVTDSVTGSGKQRQRDKWSP